MKMYCNNEARTDLCILDSSLTAIPFNPHWAGGGGHTVVVVRVALFTSVKHGLALNISNIILWTWQGLC
jgi:hypothetical protein